MYTSFTLVLAFAAASVSGLVIPRKATPATYAEGYLESYQVYHTRYLALGCQDKHNTEFFDQCCHPMLATEKLETARPPQCIPSASASASASAAEATSTISTPADGDDGDCDDDGADGDDGNAGDDECDDGEDTPTSAEAVPTTTEVVPTTTKVVPTTTKAVPTTTEVASTKVFTTRPSATTSEIEHTSTKEAATSTSKAATTTAPSSAGSSQVFTGGFATFFYQGGAAGACGTVHSDSDLVAALDVAMYGKTDVASQYCGKQVKITNTKNNKSVVVTVADACPTCKNSESIDLSVGAFTKIATEEEGMVSITWEFV